MNISERIQQEIHNTANRRGDERIRTAEDMIPLMDDTKYGNKILDIPYADGYEKEKLDIFYPDGEGDAFPVLIEVHGGGWYFGQKKSVEFEPFLYGRSRGYACVSLGYTLSPEGHYPLPVIEIKSAIRFLRKNAKKYRLDPDRIVLWGGSAGAHLAALAALSCDTEYLERDLSGNDAYLAKPNVLALWYGCFDYFENGRFGDDFVYQNFFGAENLGKIRNILRLSSPLLHITPQACPTFLQHGLADPVVPYQQSVGFTEVFEDIVGKDKVKLELLEGYSHADARMFTDENIAKILDFAERFF